jgi:hypothetical protein
MITIYRNRKLEQLELLEPNLEVGIIRGDDKTSLTFPWKYLAVDSAGEILIVCEYMVKSSQGATHFISESRVL